MADTNTTEAPVTTAAAATTQPTTAVTPPVETTASPAGRTIKYNHKPVVIPEDQIDRYLSKGMAATRLEEEKAQLKAEAQAQAQKIQMADTVMQLQRDYPDRWKLMLAASQGEKLRREDEEIEDGDLTPRNGKASIPSEYEARFQRLEAAYQAQQETFNQRDLQSQIDAAIAAQPSLRDDPQLAASLRERIEDGVAAGRYQSPEQAAMVLASEQQTLLQGALERLHATREAQKQAAVPPASGPAMTRPEIDRTKLTFKALRSGDFKKAMGEALRKAGAAITPPN